MRASHSRGLFIHHYTGEGSSIFFHQSGWRYSPKRYAFDRGRQLEDTLCSSNEPSTGKIVSGCSSEVPRSSCKAKSGDIMRRSAVEQWPVNGGE